MATNSVGAEMRALMDLDRLKAQVAMALQMLERAAEHYSADYHGHEVMAAIKVLRDALA